ncbi:MAG: hypothetical protein AAFX06_14465, partial [Planctomycetota bacterium]
MILNRTTSVREAVRQRDVSIRLASVVLVTLFATGLIQAQEPGREVSGVRKIQVVDVDGAPVAQAEVRATHWVTIKRDGKVYRLIQDLIPPTTSNLEGTVEIEPQLAEWQDGRLIVSKDGREDEKGRGRRYTHARVRFNPEDKIDEVVLRYPLVISGRLLIDGEHAARAEVCLTEEIPGKRFFGRRVGNFVLTDDKGLFELMGYHGETYGLEVQRRNGKETE